VSGLVENDSEYRIRRRRQHELRSPTPSALELLEEMVPLLAHYWPAGQGMDSDGLTAAQTDAVGGSGVDRVARQSEMFVRITTMKPLG